MPTPTRPTRASPRTPRTPAGGDNDEISQMMHTPKSNRRGRSSPSESASKRARTGENGDHVISNGHAAPSPSSGRRSRSGTPGRTPYRGSQNENGSRDPVTSEPLQPMPESSSDMPMDPSPNVPASSPLSFGGSTPGRTPGTPGSRGPPHTPRRPRADLRSAGTPRQIEQPGSEVDAPTHAAATGYIIWGTDVVVSEAKEKFKRFLQRYSMEEESLMDSDERMEGMDIHLPYYLQKLDEISTTYQPYLNINCSHLKQFDASLWEQLISYPQEVIPVCDVATNELFFERNPDTVLEHEIETRPYNVDRTSNMRYLNPEDLDCMISIQGMVIRVSNVIPDMREAFFECTVCSNSTQVAVEQGRIIEPTLCTHCQTNHSFSLIHNRSKFSDLQVIKLQESPDDMPPGQTPHSVTLQTHGSLVDSINPGDRVTVTGIYRAAPIRVVPWQRIIKSVYKTHIDVLHFRKSSNKLMSEEGSDGNEVKDQESEDMKGIKFTAERIAEIKTLAEHRFVYELLAKSLAPSIYEHDDIKKGILLQLFGGSKKDLTSAGRSHFRSDINVLLCGDPGTSKSQLLQFVHNLVPRGQYTSGKGSSAVGLTAYVTKDPDTKQLVLQSGALVLSDNGICCIDEFDKMTDGTRAVLHEVMEQQTLSIARAGIICQLNARAAILAAANPLMSHWDTGKTIVENIQLPHTLLSRFDLIFLMLDEQNERYDYHLGKHIVSLYFEDREQAEKEKLEMTLLRDYIMYARTHVNPRLSEDAGLILTEEYLNMRRFGSGRGQISAYPRQLESLIRLSEAHARMRLSQTVERPDVQEAIRLYKEALKQSITDPVSGKIDVSILTTGLSSAARRKRLEIRDAVREKIISYGRKPVIEIQKLYDDMLKTSDAHISRELFDDGLQMLVDEDFGIISNKVFRLLKFTSER